MALELPSGKAAEVANVKETGEIHRATIDLAHPGSNDHLGSFSGTTILHDFAIFNDDHPTSYLSCITPSRAVEFVGGIALGAVALRYRALDVNGSLSIPAGMLIGAGFGSTMNSIKNRLFDQYPNL
jgi:hypothetical protein